MFCDDGGTLPTKLGGGGITGDVLSLSLVATGLPGWFCNERGRLPVVPQAPVEAPPAFVAPEVLEPHAFVFAGAGGGAVGPTTGRGTVDPSGVNACGTKPTGGGSVSACTTTGGSGLTRGRGELIDEPDGER